MVRFRVAWVNSVHAMEKKRDGVVLVIHASPGRVFSFVHVFLPLFFFSSIGQFKGCIASRTGQFIWMNKHGVKSCHGRLLGLSEYVSHHRPPNVASNNDAEYNNNSILINYLVTLSRLCIQKSVHIYISSGSEERGRESESESIFSTVL